MPYFLVLIIEYNFWRNQFNGKVIVHKDSAIADFNQPTNVTHFSVVHLFYTTQIDKLLLMNKSSCWNWKVI